MFSPRQYPGEKQVCPFGRKKKKKIDRGFVLSAEQ
jgi:hypothetical protein